jgi:hypothetical protein
MKEKQAKAISNSGRAKAKMPPTEYWAWPIQPSTGEPSKERNLHRMRGNKKMDYLSLFTRNTVQQPEAAKSQSRRSPTPPPSVDE